MPLVLRRQLKADVAGNLPGWSPKESAALYRIPGADNAENGEDAWAGVGLGFEIERLESVKLAARGFGSLPDQEQVADRDSRRNNLADLKVARLVGFLLEVFVAQACNRTIGPALQVEVNVASNPLAVLRCLELLPVMRVPAESKMSTVIEYSATKRLRWRTKCS